MTYGDLNRTRKLAGNPVIADVTDADISQAIAYGDARVEAETAHQGWLVGDQGYNLVVEASEYFASSTIRDRLNDPEKQADRHYQKALDICDAISKSSALSIIAINQPYQTYPLNLSAPIYRSLPSSGSTEQEPFT
jgi:hypothetical protein